MRVGIVTVHDSANIGSYLQAIAMQEIVKRNGDEPYFIKFRSSFDTLMLFLGYNNSPSARSLIGFVKFLIRAIRNPKQTYQLLNKYLVYKKDWGKYESIISLKDAKKHKLDVVLLGSDEIWNLNKSTFENQVFYGMGIYASRKVGYAVSAGDMCFKKWRNYPHILEAISCLDDIFVRDKRTYELLKENNIKVTDIVCDPTLQIDICHMMKSKKETNVPDGKYILIYAYNVGENAREAIKTFADGEGLKTVAVSLMQDWCDEYCNCSPLEFGAVLENAEYVYTSTFHGTIFSLLYKTRTAIVPETPKVKEVVELLNGRSYVLSKNFTLEELRRIYEQKRDYSVMEKELSFIRSNSYGLYSHAILGGINENL